MRRHKGTALLGGVLLTVIAIGYGLAAESGDELAQLRRQIAEQRASMEAMEKRLLELEGKEKERAAKRLEVGYTKAGEVAGRGFSAKDIYDNGFFVRTEDGSFSLNVNGFLQARYTYFNPEEGKSNHNFDVALARLALSGSVFDPKVRYFFQFEGSTFGNNNRVTMLDWAMQYVFSPGLFIQAGRFISPYSRQYYIHPGTYLFPDLAEATFAFGLFRVIGVGVGGQLGPLSYYSAVINSARALDAGGQQNLGKEIGAFGRLELDVLDSYGYREETSPKPVEKPQLSIGVAAAYNPIDEASTFQNVMPGDRTTNVTVDAGFRWQRFTLQAAGHYRRNNLKAAGRPDSDDWGYYGQIGYYLVPERWELVARISGVNFGQPNNPTVLGDTTEYSAGLNYYLYGHHVKLQMDYSFLDRDPFRGPNRNDHRLRVQTQILF